MILQSFQISNIFTNVNLFFFYDFTNVNQLYVKYRDFFYLKYSEKNDIKHIELVIQYIIS